jgi:transcriptional regulator with XRE-family HTH domain
VIVSALSATYSDCMTPRRLKAFRTRIGVTQAEFAKGIGVSANTVARWERGEIGMAATTEALVERLMADTDLTTPVWPPAIGKKEGQ